MEPPHPLPRTASPTTGRGLAVGPVAGNGGGSTPERRRYDIDSLLTVAVGVFTERGYDGTSMEDVSRAAGLSKSSLYHHIDSKEQLLRLALERALDPLFAVTREDGATQGRAVDRLEYVVRREVQVLVDRLPYVTLLLRVRGNTATERWALERRRAFDRLVAGMVAEAVAAGDVRGQPAPAVTSRLLFGMVNSVVDWYRPVTAGQPAGEHPTAEEPEAEEPGAEEPDSQHLDPQTLAEAIVAVALDGLRTRPPSDTRGAVP